MPDSADDRVSAITVVIWGGFPEAIEARSERMVGMNGIIRLALLRPDTNGTWAITALTRGSKHEACRTLPPE